MFTEDNANDVTILITHYILNVVCARARGMRNAHAQMVDVKHHMFGFKVQILTTECGKIFERDKAYEPWQVSLVCVFLLHTWYTSHKATQILIAIYPSRVFHKSADLCTYTYKETIVPFEFGCTWQLYLVSYRVDALPQTLGWTYLELTETLEVNLVSK